MNFFTKLRKCVFLADFFSLYTIRVYIKYKNPKNPLKNRRKMPIFSENDEFLLQKYNFTYYVINII